MQCHAITSNKMQSYSIANTAIPSYILKRKDPGYRSSPIFMDFTPNFSLKTGKLLREGLDNRNKGFRPLRGYLADLGVTIAQKPPKNSIVHLKNIVFGLFF